MACLENLDKIDAISRYSIVIADDGSTDGTADKIFSEFSDRVTVLHGDGNLWWAGAIDLGMRYACENNAQYIIWLNDDCLVPEGTFENLIDFANKTPNAIIGAQGHNKSDQTQVTFGGKRRKIPHYQMFQCPVGKIMPCEMLSGNLVCIPRKTIDKIGYPDMRLPHYGADTFYLIRARKADFRLFVDARTAPIDTPGNSKMYPTSWLLQGGKPLEPFRLIFQTQSMMSWKVWWILLTCDYGLLGAIIFSFKYFVVLPKMVLISLLRFFPVNLRVKIKDLKNIILCQSIV